MDVLVIAKGGPRNLRAAEGGRFTIQRANGTVTLKNASMSALAGVMGSPFGNMPVEKVRDQTGLSGVFDITLELSAFDRNDPSFGRNYRTMRDALFVFVSSVLEKNYGLRLGHRKMPLEILVIDGGNKVPGEN